MAIREELLNLIIVLLKSQSYTTDAGPGVSGVSKIRKKSGGSKNIHFQDGNPTKNEQNRKLLLKNIKIN